MQYILNRVMQEVLGHVQLPGSMGRFWGAMWGIISLAGMKLALYIPVWLRWLVHTFVEQQCGVWGTQGFIVASSMVAKSLTGMYAWSFVT